MGSNISVTFFVPQGSYRDFVKGNHVEAYSESPRAKRIGDQYLQITADVEDVAIEPCVDKFDVVRLFRG